MKTARAVVSGARAARTVLAVTLVLSLGACLSKKPPEPPKPPPPPPVSLDTKAAWMLRLENQRVLRDAGVDAPGAVRRPAGPDAGDRR